MRDRMKAKGRRESGRFAQIPDNVLRSPEFHDLNGSGIRLLLALAAQFNGHNNGNLSASMSGLRSYGFTSSDTRSKALTSLLEAGLVIRTRSSYFLSAGKNRPGLYALAWKPINDCHGKGLEVAPTVTAPRTFKPADIAKQRVRKPDRTEPKTGRQMNNPEAIRSENRIENAHFPTSTDPKTGHPIESTKRSAISADAASL